MLAFVPAPLPPSPPILWSAELREAFDRALLALGRLDSVSSLLPDTHLFLYTYVRKEAVLFSRSRAPRPRCRTCCSMNWRRLWASPSTMSRRSPAMWQRWSMGFSACEAAFPSPTDCCARCTASCYPRGAAPTSNRESSAVRRIGSAEPARGTPPSCPLRHNVLQTAWRGSSASSMTSRSARAPCSKQRLRMSS